MKFEEKEKQLKKIMLDFDFEGIHRAMSCCNWIWVDTESGIPSVKELKQVALELLEAVYGQVCKGCWISHSHGGLKATVSPLGILKLEFVWAYADGIEP